VARAQGEGAGKVDRVVAVRRRYSLHAGLSGGKKEVAETNKKKTGTKFRSQTVVSCYQNKMQAS